MAQKCLLLSSGERPRQFSMAWQTSTKLPHDAGGMLRATVWGSPNSSGSSHDAHLPSADRGAVIQWPNQLLQDLCQPVRVVLQLLHLLLLCSRLITGHHLGQDLEWLHGWRGLRVRHTLTGFQHHCRRTGRTGELEDYVLIFMKHL